MKIFARFSVRKAISLFMVPALLISLGGLWSPRSAQAATSISITSPTDGSTATSTFLVTVDVVGGEIGDLIDFTLTGVVGSIGSIDIVDPVQTSYSTTTSVGELEGSHDLTATVTSGLGTATDTVSILFASLTPAFSSVSISPATTTIVLNSSATTSQLTAVAFDGSDEPLAEQPTFTWVSSNPLIATVDSANGLVTGIAVGTSTVSASATVGTSTFTGTSTVTVVSEPQVLTSLSISPNPASVGLGLTRQLTANALDQFGTPMATATVNWTSSDLDVATINATSGLASAVATGTTIITAEVDDVSATSTLNVVIDSQAPAITILGDNPATVTVGNTYTDAGATALDNVSGNLTSNITTISTVDANTTGTYTVTYSVTDGANNTATATRTVNVVSRSSSSSGSSSGSTPRRVTPTPTPTPSPTGSLPPGVLPYIFTSFLGQGQSGLAVQQLQERLRGLGYFTYPVSTGYFGPITLASVQAYQRDHLIPSTGFVGPLTLASLNSMAQGGAVEVNRQARIAVIQELIRVINQLIVLLQNR